MNMDLDALTIRQLRYLTAVATEPTFTDAAAHLGVTQSALSQAMARLETITGQRLFSPDGRTRRLTPTGEVIVGAARHVIGITDTLVADLTARATGSVGRLRIGMIDAVALYLAPNAVTRLKQLHPGVEVDVSVSSSSRLIDRIIHHDLDVAVVVGPVPSLVDAHQPIDEPMHIYHGSDAPTGQWVLYPSPSHTRGAIDAGLAAAGIVPDVIAESSNPDVLSRLAAMEEASTVLPIDVGSKETALIDGGVLTHRSVVAITRRGDDSALAAAFIEQVASVR